MEAVIAVRAASVDKVVPAAISSVAAAVEAAASRAAEAAVVDFPVAAAFKAVAVVVEAAAFPAEAAGVVVDFLEAEAEAAAAVEASQAVAAASKADAAAAGFNRVLCRGSGGRGSCRALINQGSVIKQKLPTRQHAPIKVFNYLPPVLWFRCC